MTEHPNPKMLTGKTIACRFGRHRFQVLKYVATRFIPRDGEFHDIEPYSVSVGKFCKRCGRPE